MRLVFSSPAGRVALVAMLFALACGRPSPPPTPAPPPRVSEPILPGPDLLADARLLRTTFEALHPGLHRYATPAQWDRAFDELTAELRGGATRRDAFRAFSVFAAKIRCGHTFLNPRNQSDGVQSALRDAPPLPFTFRWLDGRMIVTESFARDADLPPGTEITAIDGHAASEILARLETVARADGGNEAKRVASLERRGVDAFEPFDIAYSLFFGGWGERAVLDVVAPGREARRIAVSRRAPKLERAAKLDTDAAEPLWSMRYLDERTAYLRMPTWVTYHSAWDWKGDLARDVADLERRHARALVVDLRGNEGGTDVGDVLAAHLIGEPTPVEALERWTRYRRVPDALRAHLKTWDPRFFDWGDAAVPRGDGFFRLTAYDDEAGGDVLAPLAPRLHAKLVVLVDGENSSATFQFAELVQRHHLGVLVGEPTGGNQRGINGGAFFFLELPGSGLEIDLPLIGRFPHDGRTERLRDGGLDPDVLVRPTAADVARGRDVVLERAREVAAK